MGFQNTKALVLEFRNFGSGAHNLRTLYQLYPTATLKRSGLSIIGKCPEPCHPSYLRFGNTVRGWASYPTRSGVATMTAITLPVMAVTVRGWASYPTRSGVATMTAITGKV